MLYLIYFGTVQCRKAEDIGLLLIYIFVQHLSIPALLICYYSRSAL